MLHFQGCVQIKHLLSMILKKKIGLPILNIHVPGIQTEKGLFGLSYAYYICTYLVLTLMFRITNKQ